MNWLTGFTVNKQQWHTRLRSSLAVACLSVFGSNVSGLTLPNEPLLSTAGVEPNIMLFVDNSGSMAEFALGFYNSNIDYADCPSNLIIDASGGDQTIVANVANDGLVYFTHSVRSRRGSWQSVDYQWGTTETGNEAFPVACFDDGTIPVGRRGLTEPVTYNLSPDTNTDEIYTFNGNELNYYFSNATQTGPDYWSDDQTRKGGSGTRLQLTKAAGETLVNSLADKRIGLAAFEQFSTRITSSTNAGAKILVGLDDIDAQTGAGKTQRRKIIDQINGLYAQGGTPIGESLSDITRYFISGYENQQIEMHPNDAKRKRTVAADQVFSTLPTYASGVKKPSKGKNAAIQHSCQKNYLIALTDGEPQETGLISGLLTGRSSSRDTGPFTGYDPEQENSAESVTYSDIGTVFRDVGSLNDVALAMHDIDLRPDLKSSDPINISTFFVGGFNRALQDNDVLMRAAANGVGGAPEGVVYPAYNQNQLERAFETIFSLVESDDGTRASISFNSTAISADTLLYQSTYQFAANQWDGDLVAFGLNTNSNGTGANIELFNTTPEWSANDKLTARVNGLKPGDDDTRAIVTLSGFGSGLTREGVAFTPGNLTSFSAEMQSDLGGDDSDTAVAAKVVQYLRGIEFPDEFRTRIGGGFGILGDIVDSQPVEIGEPELDYPDYNASAALKFGSAQQSYSQFAKSYAKRDSVVYVGANDGMLHAFSGDKNGGDELFAYVPSLLADGNSELEGLYYLTDPSYQHRFYVNGGIGVSDVFADLHGTGDAWRTLLFGTLGLGGKGIYALDITDPAQFSEANADQIVLWEFGGETGSTTTGDADMGHIFGEPKVSMMNDGRFAVIVGNGANSTNGSAVLFILFIEEGADGSWDVDDWVEIDTGATGDNGLSTPILVDLNNDRVVDRIYAGDLKGSVWGFDVSNRNPDQWDIAHGTEPLFTASDSDGLAQPITSAPLVVINQETPYTNNEPNVLVLFGTGKFIEASDIGGSDVQSFYGVWDRGVGGLLPRDLLQRRLIDKTDLAGNVVGRVVDPQSPYSDPVAWFDNGSQDQYGWYFDLPDTGERVTIQPAVLRGAIFFLSSIPQDTPCNTGGNGYLNVITSQGLSTRTPIYDFNGDGLIDGDDQDFVSLKTEGTSGLPAGSEFIGAGESSSNCKSGDGHYQAYNTIDGGIQYRWVCPESSGGLGRMAWQELFGE